MELVPPHDLAIFLAFHRQLFALGRRDLEPLLVSRRDHVRNLDEMSVFPSAASEGHGVVPQNQGFVPLEVGTGKFFDVGLTLK